jgi:hypothetical protein
MNRRYCFLLSLLRKVMPFQCNSSAAVVTADPSVHLGKEAMALATNAEQVRPHGNNQRKPNVAELAHAKRLAMNEFLKHGYQPNFLRV